MSSSRIHLLESSDSEFEAGPSSSVPKKAKVTPTALPVPAILSLSSSALASSKKADLIEIIETLRNHISGKSNGAAAPKADLSQLIEVRVCTLSSVDSALLNSALQTKLLTKAIKASLTWKRESTVCDVKYELMQFIASCKTGSAKFSCEIHLPSHLFDEMFATKRKLFKLTTEAFEETIGPLPYGSVRYATLHIKGELSVRYKIDEETLTVSGHYGK